MVISKKKLNFLETLRKFHTKPFQTKPNHTKPNQFFGNLQKFKKKVIFKFPTICFGLEGLGLVCPWTFLLNFMKKKHENLNGLLQHWGHSIPALETEST